MRINELLKKWLKKKKSLPKSDILIPGYWYVACNGRWEIRGKIATTEQS